MTIGEKFKTYRKNLQLTLQAVSDDTNIAVSYLSDIERDKTQPSLKMLAKLTSYYGYTLPELFEDVRVEWQ